MTQKPHSEEMKKKKSFKDSKARKNILKTFRVWGGDGVENPEALLTYVDFEVQKFIRNTYEK